MPTNIQFRPPLCTRAPMWLLMTLLLTALVSLGCGAAKRNSSAASAGADGDPMQALGEAKFKGTVAALREVADKYPGTQAATEARAAMPEAALREAKRAGSVEALRSMIREYPNASEAAEARREMHALYEKSLNSFRQRAARGNAQMMPFMERLVAYLETSNDPTVEVRYLHRETPESDYLHVYEPDTDNFQSIVSTWKSIFSDFNNGMLTVSEGTPYDTPQEIQNPSKPTIGVTYTETTSLDLWFKAQNGEEFGGRFITLNVTMLIPGDARPFTFSVRGQTPSNFKFQGNPDLEAVRLALENALEKLSAIFVRPENS